jgi:hypothetical protein
MAVASPPTYGARKRKPRLRATKGLGYGNVPKPRGARAPASSGWTSGPVATPTQVTPQVQNVPDPSAAVAPPATPQAAADRITAREQYGTGMGDVNYQLRTAAQQYGGAPTVDQYGYSEDPNHPGVYLDSVSTVGANTTDPNSALAVILRNQQAQATAQNENTNQKGTFFSGINLKGQQDIVDENDRQRTAAFTQYQDAIHRLTTAMEQLRGTRGEGFRNADAADLLAAAAIPPEPEEGASAAPGGNPAPGVPPGVPPPPIPHGTGPTHTLTYRTPRRRSAVGRVQGTGTVTGGKLPRKKKK